jgi:hypothetical protein
VSGINKHVSGTNTHKLRDLVVGPKGLFECDPGSESTDNTFPANKWSVKVMLSLRIV